MSRQTCFPNRSLALLVVVFAMAGCDSHVTQSDIDDQQQNVAQAQEKLAALEQRQQVEDEMESKLTTLRSEIDGLKDQAKNAEGDREVELRGEIAKLETKDEHAQEQLRELRAASGDKWAQLKIKADESWNAVSESVREQIKQWKDDSKESRTDGGSDEGESTNE